MRALGINFVQRRRFASTLGLALLVVGVVTAGTIVLDYLDARTALGRAEASQARLFRSGSKIRKEESLPSSAREEAQAVAGLVAQLRQPWDTVLNDMEIMADPTVVLLGMEAQGQARKMRITAEAKTMGDAIAYVTRLRGSQLIESALLSGHEEKQFGQVTVIRFTTDATWSQSP